MRTGSTRSNQGPAILHSLKLVYWGPGRSGKTTNLTWLHGRLRPELQGKMISLDSPGERTLYFDSLPLTLDPGDGPAVRLRLYTVPGQPRFHLTRRLVLQGVDGLVFVWDSRSARLKANVESFLEARSVVEELGVSWQGLPRLIQYNKRDLPCVMKTGEMDAVLHRLGELEESASPARPFALREPLPRLEAVALEGVGVLATLAGIARLSLKRRLHTAA